MSTQVIDEAVASPLSAFGNVIAGQERPSRSGRTYASVDPFTREPWALAADGGARDVDDAVDAAREALSGPWQALTATARGRLLTALGRAVLENADRLAELETRDTGKLAREMRGQMTGVATWFEYFGGLADKVQGDVIPTDKPDYLVYTQNLPVGVVAAITPWNSPLLLLTWKLAPALAAGCTFVIKPSDHSPASTVEIAKLALEVGFPPGVINVVTGWGPEVGSTLAAHPGIDKVAFTGSTAVGRSVAIAAAGNFTRTTLELGGKSAQIVFPDADLEAAANGIIAGIFAATGQTCMAGSRLVVHESIHDELVERIVARARTIIVGDPAASSTEMGPLANSAQFEKVLSFFESAQDEGATIACGGTTIDELGGYFVRPTVLTNLRPDARSLREEIFGPVLSVVPFRTEREAIEIANSTEFGLAGSVWTSDLRVAHRVAGRLRAGSVWVNAYRTVAPQVPFGGLGASGIGRESGIDAIASYQEKKAIWVELSGSTRDPFTLG